MNRNPDPIGVGKELVRRKNNDERQANFSLCFDCRRYQFNLGVLVKSMPRSCTLDSLLPKDRPALFRLFTCPDGREFLGGPLDVEAAMQRSKDWVERSSSAPIWAIRRNSDQDFLGYVLLDDHHNGVDTEISYALLPEHRGRGYATDALAETFTRAFKDLGLKELVAETQAENHRSIKLLERSGMIESSRLIRFGEEQIIYRVGLVAANRQ